MADPRKIVPGSMVEMRLEGRWVRPEMSSPADTTPLKLVIKVSLCSHYRQIAKLNIILGIERGRGSGCYLCGPR